MRGENHARGTDAALGSAFFEETFLDWVELFVDGEALDGGDLSAFGLQDGDEAGVNQVSVDEDCAGSALAFSAAFFGSGEVQVFAKDIEETLHRWGFDGLGFAVDDEVDGRHLEGSENFGL